MGIAADGAGSAVQPAFPASSRERFARAIAWIVASDFSFCFFLFFFTGASCLYREPFNGFIGLDAASCTGQKVSSGYFLRI